MQAMAWWSVPLAAFVIAIVWVSVANRPRPPADPRDSISEHERFRAAMSRQLAAGPGPDVPGRDGSSDTITHPDTHAAGAVDAAGVSRAARAEGDAEPQRG
jgi:hypothetical protein